MDINLQTQEAKKQQERSENTVDLDALFRQKVPILVNENRADVERATREMWAA